MENVREVIDDQRQPVCALGVLFVASVRYAACTGAWRPGHRGSAGEELIIWQPSANVVESCLHENIDLLSDVAQGLLRVSPLERLMGSRWPLLPALDAIRIELHFGNTELACEHSPTSVLDWSKLRRAFLPDHDWISEGKPLVYARSLQGNWVKGMEDCIYGFAMVAMWKLVICAETQAECVSQYSALVDDLIQTNDWREIVGNPWPMFGFLARMQLSLMRHEFHIDFHPGELRGHAISGFGPGALTNLASVHSGNAQVSISFQGVLRSVIAGVPRTYISKSGGDQGGAVLRSFLYVTMVFGPQYVPYVPRFVARAAALGITNLVVFCLDDAALEACSALPNGDGRCVRGSPSILNKFTLPLAYLQLGVDVFWLDFDIFLMRDPTPLVLSQAEERQVELLVSGSFADDCICSGLVYFRATRVVTDWLLTVLSWMYEHTYTHDQQAFSAFLAGRPDADNVTSPERICGSKLFRLYMRVEVPRWALLDPIVEFASARVLNTTGWTGNLADMVIFHFLHGDSEVNREHSAYGWNAVHGVARAQRPLLDIFYNQSDERVYREATPPHQLNVEIHQALLASRRNERPSEMLHCGVLQLNPYSPGRMSPDG
eukprot:TRINITY_DN31908_c0_g1_i1.p1 TRINITY_DN31908_c0_g1~~TRINITY_DN31908_c0_g1_i1.p1  ORF type:complete len:704 (-),score=66.15 TRINITY_DN31908_c0_g1_i1:20-1834(-)